MTAYISRLMSRQGASGIRPRPRSRYEPEYEWHQSTWPVDIDTETSPSEIDASQRRETTERPAITRTLTNMLAGETSDVPPIADPAKEPRAKQDSSPPRVVGEREPSRTASSAEAVAAQRDDPPGAITEIRIPEAREVASPPVPSNPSPAASAERSEDAASQTRGRPSDPALPRRRLSVEPTHDDSGEPGRRSPSTPVSTPPSEPAGRVHERASTRQPQPIGEDATPASSRTKQPHRDLRPEHSTYDNPVHITHHNPIEAEPVDIRVPPPAPRSAHVAIPRNDAGIRQNIVAAIAEPAREKATDVTVFIERIDVRAPARQSASTAAEPPAVRAVPTSLDSYLRSRSRRRTR